MLLYRLSEISSLSWLAFVAVGHIETGEDSRWPSKAKSAKIQFSLTQCIISTPTSTPFSHVQPALTYVLSAASQPHSLTTLTPSHPLHPSYPVLTLWQAPYPDTSNCSTFIVSYQNLPECEDQLSVVIFISKSPFQFPLCNDNKYIWLPGP